MSRCARNSVFVVIRFLTILSAAAPALVVPVVAFAAPIGGLPVYHPLLRTSGSMAAPSSRAVPAAQQPFKVPFDLKVHPQSHELDPQTTWKPLGWRGLHPILGSLPYQPIWYQAGCYANGGLATPGASLSAPIGTSAPATNFTIGSLADGQSSNPFGSSASDVTRVASSGGVAAATSSPLTLQYGVGTTPCGSTNYFGF